MADAPILDACCRRARPSRAAYRALLRNPGVMFGAAVFYDRIADGALRALARNHRSDGDQPDRAKQGARRRKSRCGRTPANASR